jgi:hypothetical protein
MIERQRLSTMPELAKAILAALAIESVESWDGPIWDGTVTDDGMKISAARVAFAILLGQPIPRPCTQEEWEMVQEKHLFHDWEPTKEERLAMQAMAEAETPA